MKVLARLINNGLLSYIATARRTPKSEGEPDSAEYCYGVWMKHLVLLHKNGMRTIPSTLVELGPGSSLGVGLCALLSGVNTYYALDMVRYTDTAKNCNMLDELIQLFQLRTARPTKGWPDFDKFLDTNLFPGSILTDHLLRVSMSKKRISLIREALTNSNFFHKNISVKYIVPWSGERDIESGTVDVVISHAVLEHVVDLDKTYGSIYAWLKPGGMMSHQIDFTSHGLSQEWNGYRSFSEIMWKLMVGKQTYLINRQPYSVHRRLIKKNGFKMKCELKKYRKDGIQRSQLSSRWRNISADDLSCSGTFIQAQK